MLSEAKHLWMSLSRRPTDDQRFFASLRMTRRRSQYPLCFLSVYRRNPRFKVSTPRTSRASPRRQRICECLRLFFPSPLRSHLATSGIFSRPTPTYRPVAVFAFSGVSLRSTASVDFESSSISSGLIVRQSHPANSRIWLVLRKLAPITSVEISNFL